MAKREEDIYVEMYIKKNAGEAEALGTALPVVERNFEGVTLPQIPHLAKGAVLPANKPFLAVVGDQRYGTNVEAPLATIQEAVAQVMQDNTAAMAAGLAASVEVQREILQAVLGIQVGDDVIGSAVSRYQRKMAVVNGGTV